MNKKLRKSLTRTFPIALIIFLAVHYRKFSSLDSANGADPFVVKNISTVIAET